MVEPKSGRILKVRAPFLLGIIDVIAIPRLTRFFGTRLLPLGACATPKARYNEEGEKTGDFAAGECVFHIFSFPKDASSCSLWQKL